MKQKRAYVVYSMRIANKLIEMGYKLKGISVDKSNPRFNVFYFEFSDELLEAIELLK